MKKYYKKMSKKVIIAYIISITAFAAIFALSYAILRNIDPLIVGTGNIILTITAFAVTGIACYVSCRSMKNAVISTDENISVSESLATLLKRAVSVPLLLALMNFALSLFGGVLVSYAADAFTELRYDNFAQFSTVVKIPLFVGFLIFLALIGHYNGFSDAKTRSFNPHIILVALLLSFTFMMPATVSDHMYDNSEVQGNVAYSLAGHAGMRSQGKIIYNLQTVFSGNADLYKDNYTKALSDEFSAARVVWSILLSAAVQIFVTMAAYNIGAKKYYRRKRPDFAKGAE
jgi:fatty acid desaturase